MLLSVSEICNQYAWLYLEPFRQDVWDYVFPVDGAFVCVKQVDDVSYVFFRGSTTFLDWIEDFQDAAIPYDDPDLGLVHPGARDGVLLVRPLLKDVVGEKSIICGHSLGALHAGIYAGYLTVEGCTPQSLILWGEPKAGGNQLHNIIQKSGATVYSYLNQDKDGHDLITDVPFDIPEIAPYRHVSSDFIPVSASPQPDDPWLLFRYHHFYLYGRALGADSPQIRALSH